MDNMISIDWVSLSFFSKLEKKTTTNKIKGYFNFGSLNALIGSSGAGKTKLLKCMIGRHRSEIID